MTKESWQKLKYLENEKSIFQKAFFIIFKGFISSDLRVRLSKSQKTRASFTLFLDNEFSEYEETSNPSHLISSKYQTQNENKNN